MTRDDTWACGDLWARRIGTITTKTNWCAIVFSAPWTGYYQSKMHCWTGKPVQQCILPVQRTGGRVPGWAYGDTRVSSKSWLTGKWPSYHSPQQPQSPALATEPAHCYWLYWKHHKRYSSNTDNTNSASHAYNGQGGLWALWSNN